MIARTPGTLQSKAPGFFISPTADRQPEYLLWKLCGVRAREYTNATTGMVNARNGQFDLDIADALGLPRALFPKLQQPGTIIGQYEGIKCVLRATHDTGSAVEGISMEGNEPYISSGTWSLLGVKTPKSPPRTRAASPPTIPTRAARPSRRSGTWQSM